MKENINWYDRPQRIKEWWNNDISYIMFVDENGTDGKVIDIKNKLANNIDITDDEKYFTLTGCIFKNVDYGYTSNKLFYLKNKYWNKGFYYDTKQNLYKYVCLHSRDIRRHEKAFSDTLIKYKSFINDLSNILVDVNCNIISVTVNLVDYIQINETLNVYQLAFDLLIKTFKNYLKEKKAVIVLESRGKYNDKKLLHHIVNLFSLYNKQHYVDNILGIYFNPKWLEGHSSTLVGLEIADLFSYPIHQYIKYNKNNKAFDAIKDKIIGYPNIKEHGLIIYQIEKEE